MTPEDLHRLHRECIKALHKIHRRSDRDLQSAGIKSFSASMDQRRAILEQRRLENQAQEAYQQARQHLFDAAQWEVLNSAAHPTLLASRKRKGEVQ